MVEKLNEQTWLIEEYKAIRRLYVPAHRKGKGIIDRYRFLEQFHLKSKAWRTYRLPGHCGNWRMPTCRLAGWRGTGKSIWGSMWSLVKKTKKNPLWGNTAREDVRHIFTQDELLRCKRKLQLFWRMRCIEIGDRPVRVVSIIGVVGSVCFLWWKEQMDVHRGVCCKAHVLLQMEFFCAPMQTYKESLEKLIASGISTILPGRDIISNRRETGDTWFPWQLWKELQVAQWKVPSFLWAKQDC